MTLYPLRKQVKIYFYTHTDAKCTSAWLRQKSPVENKGHAQRQQIFSPGLLCTGCQNLTITAAAGTKCNWTESKNLLQGGKRTQCMAGTSSQPQPSPNKTLKGKRIECTTQVHTLLSQKLNEGFYIIIALCNLYQSQTTHKILSPYFYAFHASSDVSMNFTV